MEQNGKERRAQSNFTVKLPYISLNSTAEHTENAEAPENISNF